jgi:hypothetical protein
MWPRRGAPTGAPISAAWTRAGIGPPAEGPRQPPRPRHPAATVATADPPPGMVHLQPVDPACGAEKIRHRWAITARAILRQCPDPPRRVGINLEKAVGQESTG